MRDPQEYIDGVEFCAKCGTRLVAHRPWEPSGGEPQGYWREMATVAGFLNRHDAHLLCGALRWRGFDAVVMDENIISVDWFKAIACGWVKVKVPLEHATIVRDLLTQDWSLQPGDVEFSDDESCYPPCPQCSSRRTYRHLFSWLSLPFLLFLGLLVLIPRSLMICEACGKKWRARGL
ncbi:MAG: hypothetical protein U0V87_13255 [Acidobacteriota bacterium]